MRKYDGMSDYEINKLVSEVMGVHGNFADPTKIGLDEFLDGNFDMPDGFCSDPLYAWPIIQSNGISILSPYNGRVKWSAGSAREEIPYEGDWFDILHKDRNPLRAAMIVFLMMQESKDA